MRTDKLSHWLQGAALVVAIVGLWFLSRKNSAGAIEQSAPATLPTSPGITFGDVIQPGVQPGQIYVGGNPIYTTYNYPPATPNPAGSTTANDGGQAQAPFIPAPSCSGDCGGCCGGSKCADLQLTVSGLSGAYEGRVPNQTGNLFSLDSKGQYQYI